MESTIVNSKEAKIKALPREKMVWLLRALADRIESGELEYSDSWWQWEEKNGRLVSAVLDGEFEPRS